MGTLTVRENFSFSAALRLPTSVSQDEKDQKVNKLIQELGLSRVADSRVRHRMDNSQKHLQRKTREGKKEEKSEEGRSVAGKQKEELSKKNNKEQ